MFSHIKGSTVLAFSFVGKILFIFFFGIFALSLWLNEFALVNRWFFSFLLVKALIVLIGLLVTPIPLWALVLLSFLPPPIIMPIFFVAFILGLSHF